MSSSRASLDWWTDPSTVESIREFAHLAGVLVRSSPSNCDKSAVNVPVTLRPSKFPREQFELAMSIQPDLNYLLDAVSRDEQFLQESLESVLKVDDFTRRLFQLHLDSQAAAIKPKTVICLSRSDYLLDYQHGHKKACHSEDTPTFSIKQVEINTISVSLSGLCQGPIQRLHKFVHSRYIGGARALNIPETQPVVEAFAVACAQYGNPDAHVLFVVDAEESNTYDQRALEFDLWERYQIMVIRKTLDELGTEASLGTNQELFVSGLEVAVVYYRTAFSPEQYASEKDWATRQLLECSRAASCPSVALQLVGTKKIQQVLAIPGVLERFLDDPARIEKIRSTFTGLYSLALGPEGDLAVEKALAKPENFVLKPQREGGGNNYFDNDLCTMLEEVGGSAEREGYILMDRLHPPLQPSFFLDSQTEQITAADLVCELGVYGLYVSHGDQVLLNKAGGATARSKVPNSNEAGLATGAGKLDNVEVVSTQEFMQHLVSK